MSLSVLIAISVAVLCVIALSIRKSGTETRNSRIDDAGAAIVEFGKAYPALAIRSVVMTAGHEAAFLRLADGRAGFVQPVGRHFLTRLLPANAVRVAPSPDERTLVLDFREVSFPGGSFRFKSAADAAEVALWLVGSLAIENRSDERAGDGGGDA
ncbi:hypothetical protein [Pararhizobium haloflavum]|uniref:hypothetical protein n=1 Tax=Pararhizobium haloflavum TaxID=2037914 RepID=UPI000C19E515|nr:hypothetical protein [Pararhizobium haloflavum]